MQSVLAPDPRTRTAVLPIAYKYTSSNRCWHLTHEHEPRSSQSHINTPHPISRSCRPLDGHCMGGGKKPRATPISYLGIIIGFTVDSSFGHDLHHGATSIYSRIKFTRVVADCRLFIFAHTFLKCHPSRESITHRATELIGREAQQHSNKEPSVNAGSERRR